MTLSWRSMNCLVANGSLVYCTLLTYCARFAGLAGGKFPLRNFVRGNLEIHDTTRTTHTPRKRRKHLGHPELAVCHDVTLDIVTHRVGPGKTPTVHPCPLRRRGRGWLDLHDTHKSTTPSKSQHGSGAAQRTTATPRQPLPMSTSPQHNGRPTQEELVGDDPRTDQDQHDPSPANVMLERKLLPQPSKYQDPDKTRKGIKCDLTGDEDNLDETVAETVRGSLHHFRGQSNDVSSCEAWQVWRYLT